MVIPRILSEREQRINHSFSLGMFKIYSSSVFFILSAAMIFLHSQVSDHLEGLRLRHPSSVSEALG